MDNNIKQLDGAQIPGALAEAYEIVPGRADAGLIILCDHASNTLPDEYGTLGLDPKQLERHIAYDIGCEGVSRTLAKMLNAPAILTRYSRLLIDPNRGEDDPTLIMRISDGAVVPGNRHICSVERDKRLNTYYRPYHQAIDALIDQCQATGVTPTLFSIHSFTENWRGYSRPWHVGILWDQDARLAKPLLDVLAAQTDLVVGDNEPYSGEMHGDCMWQHGTCRNLPHAIVELRQDLIGSIDGQNHWATRLAQALRQLKNSPDLQIKFPQLVAPE
ncbi:MAG: N-formylglutamate amidohydrolase [Hyphomicrobiaceae bacterium]